MELLQLPLGFGLRDDATFSSFYATTNIAAKDCILTMAKGGGEKFCYLYGSVGVGKTHLLHAACHIAYEHNQSAMYMPLEEYSRMSLHELADLSSINLIRLDDVDKISGVANWEEAVFHLYNRIKDNGSRLIVSANASPANLSIKMPDLKSRMAWGMSFLLQPLTDEDKALVLKQRAKSRGIILTDVVSRFLLTHCARDMTGLFASLDKLDCASIAEKRKITIPFIKQVLGI